MTNKNTKKMIKLSDSIYNVVNNEFLTKAHMYFFNEELLNKPLGKFVTKFLKIKNIARWLNSQDKTSIVDGLNCLIKNIEENKEIYYQIYPDEEIKKNSSKEKARLYHFPIDNKTPFIIVCPGGAYTDCVAIWEGYPIAQKINELGYSAFVLKYRVGEDGSNLAQMEDLVKAITYILDKAEEFNIESTDYAVMGFSAGGHLAGSYGTKHLGFRRHNLLPPSALILSYPVISMQLLTHKKMRNYLLGENPSKAVMDRYSIHKNIDPNYPATFIWQCKEDKEVQMEHSLLLEKSLNIAKVENQLLLFEGGKHGLGLGIGTNTEGWLERSIEFWRKVSE